MLHSGSVSKEVSTGFADGLVRKSEESHRIHQFSSEQWKSGAAMC